MGFPQNGTLHVFPTSAMDLDDDLGSHLTGRPMSALYISCQVQRYRVYFAGAVGHGAGGFALCRTSADWWCLDNYMILYGLAILANVLGIVTFLCEIRPTTDCNLGFWTRLFFTVLFSAGSQDFDPWTVDRDIPIYIYNIHPLLTINNQY